MPKGCPGMQEGCPGDTQGMPRDAGAVQAGPAMLPPDRQGILVLWEGTCVNEFSSPLCEGHSAVFLARFLCSQVERSPGGRGRLSGCKGGETAELSLS